MAKAVIAIAKSEDQAVRIVEQLKAAGFSNNDVSVLLPDRAGSRDFAHEHHTKAPEGAATGAVVGGLAAATLSLNVVLRIHSSARVIPLDVAGPLIGAATASDSRGAPGGIAA